MRISQTISPRINHLAPYFDGSAMTNGQPWRAAWPLQEGAAAGSAMTAGREHWYLLSWQFDRAATTGAINVITGVGSTSIVVGVYRLGAGNIPGTQTGRFVLDSASNGYKTFTLTSPWMPGTWRWVCIYTEGAVTVVSASPSNAPVLTLGQGSNAPAGAFSRDSIAVANAAPATAPALTALTIRNIAIPCLMGKS